MKVSWYVPWAGAEVLISLLSGDAEQLVDSAQHRPLCASLPPTLAQPLLTAGDTEVGKLLLLFTWGRNPGSWTTLRTRQAQELQLERAPHDQFCNHQSTQDPWLGTSQGSPYQFPRNIPAPTAEAPEPGAAATCCRPDACSRQHPNESVRQCCGQLANSRAPLSPA